MQDKQDATCRGDSSRPSCCRTAGKSPGDLRRAKRRPVVQKKSIIVQRVDITRRRPARDIDLSYRIPVLPQHLSRTHVAGDRKQFGKEACY